MNDAGTGFAWSARQRWIGFLLVLVLVTALTSTFVIRAVAAQERRLVPTAATKLDRALDLRSVLSRPHVVFRSTASGPTYGSMAAVPLKRPDGERAVSATSCERVYATVEVGICLTADRGAVTTYGGTLLDPALAPVRDLKINGAPSRARLSSDGSLAATTVFVAGHGYGTIGFSTETSIVGTAAGKARINYQNLEKEFSVVIDGRRTKAADLNVWGVTFRPGPHPKIFYATIATGGKTWLVEGNLTERVMVALRPDAECPSLSPDGKTVVYKRRDGSPINWRYHALDLRTGREWPLNEKRSVDDQVEWLDNDHVLYGLPRSGTGQTDVWMADVKSRSEPSIFIPDAASPAVVRETHAGG